MKSLPLIVSLLVVGVGASTALAKTEGRVLLNRDATYEQDLRWEASADKAITPSKVIRYMMGRSGRTLSAPSATEFQPIVDANNYHLRVIAAIAYKF